MYQLTEGKMDMKHKKVTSTIGNSLGELAPAFVQYTDEVLFGDMWRRTELSLRDRSLITISSLITGGSLEQLPYHIKLAKENGLNEEELIEIMTHLAFYVGWPKASSALLLTKRLSLE